jgi:hypothetical protein
MKVWLFLLATLMLQELFSSAAIVTPLYVAHYSTVLIHLTFIIATILDISIGYYVGSSIKKNASSNRFVTFIEKKAARYKFLSRGTARRRLALFIFGPPLFPVTAFFAPLVGYSFYESFSILLLGEMTFWYVPEWLLILGLHTFVGSHLWMISIMLIVIFWVYPLFNDSSFSRK